ncbi:MAG TPA: hypothetical protein VE999_16750 [Gemmataceae bacterium]|nr:hypothetical protein [Gemmataceae bacterium]
MLKQGVFVVAAILSVLPLGCFGGPSRRVVYRCRLGSYELRIVREKEDLENPHLFYEVIGPDGVVKHRSYLATERFRSFTFSSVVDEQAGIVAIVENYRPTVFVAAFDLKNLQVWPDRDKTFADRQAMEDRVAKQLASFTGRSGWRGGEPVGIEPPTAPE